MRSAITHWGRFPLLLLWTGLSGCGGPSNDPIDWSAIEAEVQVIRSAPVTAITPAQAGQTFALGSDATDLQRDLLKKELTGAVLEWNIAVYEVEYQDGFYRVISQPLPVARSDVVPLLRVVAFVRSQGEGDDELLRAVKTNESIRIRGRVRNIILRTAVEVSPAVLVDGLAAAREART